MNNQVHKMMFVTLKCAETRPLGWLHVKNADFFDYYLKKLLLQKNAYCALLMHHFVHGQSCG